MSGAASATSRYTKLRQALDSDFFNQNWVEVKNEFNQKSNGTFVDLFSGAGGLSLGFVQAGMKKLLSIEINEYASSTIRRNFKESPHIESPIEDVSDQEIIDIIGDAQVDIVCGGPPCQGFSVAGRRISDDPRNKLFMEFCRVVELLKPKYFVMENVPGILTMEKGAVYRAILERFAQCGYTDTSVRILEAAEYGAPQLRTRAIFVGNRVAHKNPYPAPVFDKENYRTIDSAIDDLADHPRDASINHEWTAHSAEYEKRIAQVPPGGSLYPSFRDAFKRQYSGVPSMTAKENHGGTHIHHFKNRVLSARELARLQTFPDDFIFEGGMKKAYWQIGNAVPCVMSKAIAHAIGSQLKISTNQTNDL